MPPPAQIAQVPRALRSTALGAVLAWLVTAVVSSCAATEPDAPSHSLPRDLIIPWETPAERAQRLGLVTDAQAPVELRPLESCGDSHVGFAGWVESFRRHALQQGISQATVTSALGSVAYDAEVVALDRSQAAFKLSFAEFSRKHLTAERLTQGAALRRKHAPLLARIEAQFGVPSSILVALWGLETDYGNNAGDRSCLNALATLAYDCRRSERFRAELLSALRLVDRGDLAPERMVGAWAGEIGQTQFLPSSYEQYAVDFDGDGRADLVSSVADALASTANYLQQKGWQAKEGFAPRSDNFRVLLQWNSSEVYCKTVALFATKLASKKP